MILSSGPGAELFPCPGNKSRADWTEPADEQPILAHRSTRPAKSACCRAVFQYTSHRKGPSMPAISAADAISPAIQRTRNFLFRPFRLGTYLKLCVVALLTEGTTGTASTPHHPRGSHSSHLRRTSRRSRRFHVTPAEIAAGVATFALVALIGLFIYYLITRLRFAYFHCLVHNIREIRPGWRFYREPATRFFWFNVAVYLGFLLALGLVLMPFAAGFAGALPQLPGRRSPQLRSHLRALPAADPDLPALRPGRHRCAHPAA